jgi:hypothetical protein
VGGWVGGWVLFVCVCVCVCGVCVCVCTRARARALACVYVCYEHHYELYNVYYTAV